MNVYLQIFLGVLVVIGIGGLFVMAFVAGLIRGSRVQRKMFRDKFKGMDDEQFDGFMDAVDRGNFFMHETTKEEVMAQREASKINPSMMN